MMHGHEKSDLAIVAEKPANKAEQPTAEASTGASAAEPVERRAGTKGKCGPAKHVPGAELDKRVTGAGTHTAICRHTPEVGAVCGKAARTVLCGELAHEPGRAWRRGAASHASSGRDRRCVRRQHLGAARRRTPRHRSQR